MTWLYRLLLILIFLQALAVAALTGKKLLGVKAELPDLSVLDPYTIAELEHLALRAETGTAEDWRELAQALLGEGYYCHAEQCYRQVIKLKPADYEAEFHVAFCLDRTGRLDECIKLYQQIAAKTKAKFRQTCYFFLARAYLRQEKPQEALQAVASANALSSSRLLAAKTLLGLGRTELALQEITIGLAEKPMSIKLLQLNAIALERFGKTDEAHATRELVQRGEYQLSLNPNTNFIDQYNRRYGFAREIEAFNEKIDSNKHRESATQLAKLSSRMDEFDDRIKTLLLFSEANLGFYLNKPQKTLAAIQQLRALGENRADVSQLEANAFQQLGDMEQAEAAWLRAAKLNPSARLHEQLAEYYNSVQKNQQSIYHASQAASMRGHELFHKNKLASAKREFQSALELNETNSLAWFYLGEIERYYNNQSEAEQAYQKCLEINPDFGRALTGLERLATQIK